MFRFLLLLLIAHVSAQSEADYYFQATTCPEDTAITVASECINAAEYALDYSQVVKTGDYAPYGVATSYDGGMPEGCHVWDTNPPNMWVRFQGYDGLNVDTAWGTLCSAADSAFNQITYQALAPGSVCSSLDVVGISFANTVDNAACSGAGSTDVCCALFTIPTPTIAPTTFGHVDPPQCLAQTTVNSVQMTNPYTFNNVAYDPVTPIGVGTGAYTLTGVTTDHPIGFEVSDPLLLSVSAGAGGTYLLTAGGIDYYIGTVVLTIHGNFNVASYRCWRDGYMGGENHLKWSDNCETLSPTRNPTKNPTQTPTLSPTTSAPTGNPTQFPSTSPTSTVCCEFDMCYDDTDGDGVPDHIEGCDVDTDGDGIENCLDVDDDNDSILTEFEHGGDGFDAVDCNSNGVPDYLDPDDDGDGVLTIIEVNGNVNSPTDDTVLVDTDGDGNLDKCDIDDDGDGILTSTEAGGQPADGFVKHIGGTCGTGGTEVDDSLCVAATQAKRRLESEQQTKNTNIDLTPILIQ